ncbi:MAG: hypothetical protein AAGO57_09450, partial [Pseudomonadota bacterium]
MSEDIDKPSDLPDLPDLPILLRIGLSALLSVAIGSFSYSVLLIVASPSLVFLAGMPVAFVAAGGAFIYLWRIAIRTASAKLARRNWWHVKMEEDDTGLIFVWQPQRWSDLVPKPSFMFRIFQVGAGLYVLFGSFAFVSANSGFIIGPRNLASCLSVTLQVPEDSTYIPVPKM